jgi:hypothetical protein
VSTLIRYARAPSAAFRAHLASGGFLSPLLRPRSVAGLPLDVHFREGDHVHVYCGLTRLADARLAGKRVHLRAHSTYVSQPCAAGLFRIWKLDEDGFDDAWDRYLCDVRVRQALVASEGTVQARWSAATGPWTPFDREAVLGYPDTGAQKVGRGFPAVAAARVELEELRLERQWASMSLGKVGAELDQLAVDSDGRLVLLELKDSAASPASVYYSPLQLLQYVHEWAVAFGMVREQLLALIDARKALGLSPAQTPDLIQGLRPIIGFGADFRSAEVRARFDAVRAIIDRHLPAEASPIEAWALRGITPERVG